MGCPVEACTEVIGGTWKGKILFILFTGTKRFGELRKLLPDTTQRMLTMQLRELEEDGIIERKVYPQVPPKVEYSISPQGESLKPIIDSMWHWGPRLPQQTPRRRRISLGRGGMRRHPELMGALRKNDAPGKTPQQTELRSHRLEPEAYGSDRLGCGHRTFL
jgi:DNA-binding HxlR family transcriptional regulator